MQKIKIVMLQDFFGLNLSYQENELSETYVKLGYDVTVITSTFEKVNDYIANRYDSKKKNQTFIYNGVKIIRLPYAINFLNKLRWHKGVYEILEKERPDLIYAHDIHFNIRESVAYIKKYKNVKLIMDYHADFNNSAKNWISLNILHKLIRKSFLYHYLKYIDQVYPVSPSCADFLNEVYNIEKEKMVLLPLGCNYDSHCKIMESTDRANLRKAIGISKDAFVIITGGKFNPRKKTEEVIDAVLKLNNPNVYLLIFGTPEYGFEEYSEKILKKLEGSENIRFLSYLQPNNMLEFMYVSDIAIYPASQSALWQQSIGMHLPVILGGEKVEHLEYLNKNDNVIILDSCGLVSEQILNHLLRLLDNPALLNNMKKGAEKTAKEFLDYKKIAQTTLQVLEK